jgi:hypothetical protein
MSLSDDRTALDALDMVYRQGLTQTDVRLKYRLSRGAVAGFFDRDRKAHEADPTKHLNGTMPERWWIDGLRKRKNV